jgi:hypothetical protein
MVSWWTTPSWSIDIRTIGCPAEMNGEKVSELPGARRVKARRTEPASAA